MDINVLPVWKKGITGKGVVVSILDDGRKSLLCSSRVYPIISLKKGHGKSQGGRGTGCLVSQNQ